MKRIIVILAALSMSAFAALPAAANPFLIVTADHLGGGFVRYILQVDNQVLGGNVAAQISVQGNINQVPTAFFPDVFPNGGASLQSEADLADMFDPAYVAGGGSTADSFWNDQVYTTPNPPFGGALGGAVGSTLFQFSAGTFGLVGPNTTFLGQIVIIDPAAAGLPLGPQPVSTTGGFAPMNVINPNPVDPSLDSLLAAAGQTNSIAGSFFVIPEPGTLALLGIGLVALGLLFRRP